MTVYLYLETAIHGLDRVDHLISIVENEANSDALLKSKLCEDMMSLDEQLSIAIGFTLRAILPISGKDEIDLGIANSINQLCTLSTQARAILQDVSQEEFALHAKITITHRAGEALLSQDVDSYVNQFAIPNMWFHLSMAYAILRSNGISIGKADFDGLHQYASDFSFE